MIPNIPEKIHGFKMIGYTIGVKRILKYQIKPVFAAIEKILAVLLNHLEPGGLRQEEISIGRLNHGRAEFHRDLG